MNYDFSKYFDYCKNTVSELITHVDSDDMQWLAEHDHWESFTDEFIDDVKAKKCFLDIGAGLGFYSLIAKKYNPDIRVIAIEADPARAAALRYFLDVDIYDFAAGKDFGVTTVDKAQTCSSSVINRQGGYPVPVISLNMLYENRLLDDVDIMKVDIEGAELEMFKGAEIFIQEKHPVIYLEAHFSDRIPLIGGTKADMELLLGIYKYNVTLDKSRHVLR